MPTFREKFAKWSALSANLKLLLDEVPSLEEEQQALEAIVAKGRALTARQNELAAELRKTITARQDLELEAHQLREYVVVVLRRKLGAYSRRLSEVGIKPRRIPESGSRRRRAKSAEKTAS